MPIIDWHLVGVLIVLFVIWAAFFCALLIVKGAAKAFRIDNFLFKRKCKHKYKLKLWCHKCHDVKGVEE